MEAMGLNANVTSASGVNKSEILDLFEVFKANESEQFDAYKTVAYVFGTIIFLSNLTVVISSGLILKKGQQPKSTYLLLGNVSLADTIIGISVMFGITVENPMSSNPLCIFQIGMLVCPAMVSIFSVGLIAVDRYIYILHGLYYQRWFSTTRVRIGILCIWMIGITLGFLPATGWVNSELMHSRCYYVSLFPGAIILLNSLLSIIPIVLVAVLYSIILVRALKNVDEINSAVKIVDANSNVNPQMRIYRGNGNYKKTAQSVKFPTITDNIRIKRSASFNGNVNCKEKPIVVKINEKSKSNENLNESEYTKNNVNLQNNNKQHIYESDFSVYTISSSIVESSNFASSNTEVNDERKFKVCGKKKDPKRKIKEANKWRAIIVVMLTSGSFIVTWMPFFITVIFFVFCEEKLTNPKCMRLRMMLGGPIATLAFLNSILNPMIYAWWHKGFKRSIKMYFLKYLYQCFRRN